MSSTPLSDPSVVEMHDPHLYERRAVVPAIAGGFDAITDAHVQQYQELGFLSIDDAFTPDEVRAGVDGLLHLIAGGNPEFKGIQFEAAAREILPTLSVEQRQDAVRKLMYFVDFDARLKAMSHHPKLLATVQRMLGPGSPPQMFQDMALLKPPKLGREKPWHQDKAYFNIDVREPVVGVWVALDEATPDNGCMHLLPDLERVPQLHYMRRDWQICDTQILGKSCIAAPLKPGGVLLFDGLLVHGTPHNGSALRRRAVQFHYHGNRFAKIENDARMAIYGGEGASVEC